MAGMAAGWGRWGQPLGDVYKKVEEPSTPSTPSVDTAPSKPPKMEFAYNTGDMNAPRPNFRYSGMMGNQGILPQVGDPFRTYGTVSGGRMTPPANPFAQNQPIRYTPGGEYGNMPGQINTGPSQTPPWFQPPTGGFTGGRMPPDIQSQSAGASTMPQIVPNRPFPNMSGVGRRQVGYNNPQTSIPNMQRGNPMSRPGLRGAYGGSSETLPNTPFRNNLFY